MAPANAARSVTGAARRLTQGNRHETSIRSPSSAPTGCLRRDAVYTTPGRTPCQLISTVAARRSSRPSQASAGARSARVSLRFCIR